MYERAHHRRILQALEAMDAAYLQATDCFFGGGTAIVLQLHEYRESVDIDFLCASRDGYRDLRNTIGPQSLGRLFKTPLPLAREVRADRYGIRTFVEVGGQPVKFEIVSAGRIALASAPQPDLPVPVLSRSDLFAEKLLANVDRWADRGVANRDAIDLAMMIDGWGPIPEAAWQKAEAAYGDAVRRCLTAAAERLGDEEHLARCLGALRIDASLAGRIRKALDQRSAGPDRTAHPDQPP